MIHLLRAIHEAPCNHTRQPVRLDNDNNPPCFSAPSRLSLLYSAPSVASIDGWVLFSHFSPAPWLKERLAACENVWCEAAEFVSDYMHTEKGKHKRRTTSLARKRVTTSCRNFSNSASESLIISLLPFRALASFARFKSCCTCTIIVVTCMGSNIQDFGSIVERLYYEVPAKSLFADYLYDVLCNSKTMHKQWRIQDLEGGFPG